MRYISIMKVRYRLVAAAFMCAFLLFDAPGSFAQRVRHNFVSGTDFSKYKTYKWVKLEQLEYPSTDVDQQIRRAIDAQLSSRGLSRVETGNADLLAIYQAAIRQDTQWNAYSSNDGYWDYGGWYGWGGGKEKKTRSIINVGTLNLDFYDVALRKQVWRGEATKTIKPPKDPVKLQQRINTAMGKLMRNFPPPPEKN